MIGLSYIPFFEVDLSLYDLTFGDNQCGVVLVTHPLIGLTSDGLLLHNPYSSGLAFFLSFFNYRG